MAGLGLTFALDAIANQSAAGSSNASRIESIERIDITGTGANTPTLTLRDMIDMPGMNSFNNANGWADGTHNLAGGGGSPEERHQLVVEGNAGDSVTSIGWGASVGTVTNGGHTYAVYNQGSFAQLLIDTTITRSVAQRKTAYWRPLPPPPAPSKSLGGRSAAPPRAFPRGWIWCAPTSPATCPGRRPTPCARRAA